MDKDKQRDLAYIRKFSSLNLAEICREFNIDRPNTLNGIIRASDAKRIKERIHEKIQELEKLF